MTVTVKRVLLRGGEREKRVVLRSVDSVAFLFVCLLAGCQVEFTVAYYQYRYQLPS